MTVKDYWSYTYRNRRTGAKYHPPFPDNVRLEVNYDSSVKALVFLMKNHLNVPENKIREFFSEMTEGGICLSRGLINGMNREFSEKTEEERNDIFARLAASEVLSADTRFCMTMTKHFITTGAHIRNATNTIFVI